MISFNFPIKSMFCVYKRNVSRNKRQYSIFSELIVSQSKKEGKDQKSIQSSTTPDPGYQ